MAGQTGQFVGFVPIGGSLSITVVTRNTSNVPLDATTLPTYRIYGPAGIMANGTGSLAVKDSGVVAGATNASPIVITDVNHGLTTGTRVTVAAVGGNTAANGDFTVTRVDADTFSLDGSTGNGVYTSGGTWHVAGLYSLTYSPTVGNGFATTGLYAILVNATVSSNNLAEMFYFQVS